MSGYVYSDSESYPESEREFDSSLERGSNYQPDYYPEPGRRRTSANDQPVASPRKPPRPTANMATSDPAYPWYPNGSNPEIMNTSIEMDDLILTEKPYDELIAEEISNDMYTTPDTLERAKLSQPKPEPARTNRSRPEEHNTRPTPQPRPERTNPITVDPPSSTRPAQRQRSESQDQLKPDPPSSTWPAQRQRSESQDQLKPDGTSFTQPRISKEEKHKAMRKNKIIAGDQFEIEDEYENFCMQRHKRVVMAVVFLLLFIVVVAIAVGAKNASFVSTSSVFASMKGTPCTYECQNPDSFVKPPLIVIALNGFRKDRLKHKMLVENLARLAECGVHGATIPAYPSTAIPNLYSIVTGIYPSFHGKTADWLRAYGPNATDYGPTEHPSTYSRRDPQWFQRNALWGVAAESGRITASHSWIGREGDIDAMLPPSPSYYQTFNSDVGYDARLQTVLNWLHLDQSERPEFITVYFEDPGVTAQRYGYEHQETMDSLARIDSALGRFLDELMKEGLLGCVNIMVVSTGGMEDISCDRVYYLMDNIQKVNNFVVNPDTTISVGRITPTENSSSELDTAQEILQHLQCLVIDGHVFTKKELPVRFHASYGLNPDDTMVLMDPRWTFAKKPVNYNRELCKGASDGYGPLGTNMQGLFIGFGRDFEVAKTVDPVYNVDLYNLMATLIDVVPKPNNGTPGILNSALKTVVAAPVLPDKEYSSPANGDCSYPETDVEYNQRQFTSDTGCTCSQNALNANPQTMDVTLEEMDVNLEQTNSASSRGRNAPYGLPRVLSDVGPSGQQYCELYQNNYITAYENKLGIALFATFTLRRNSGSVTPLENCIRYDVRLLPERSPKCSAYNPAQNLQLPVGVDWALLYDPSLADNVDNLFNALISSNIVPQYTSFKQNIWSLLPAMIRHWSSNDNRSAETNVVIGPAYDYNSDTRRDSYHEIGASNAWVLDTPVPTHFFIVVSRCLEDVGLSMCPLQSLEVASFILPNARTAEICFMFDHYLATHRASVSDVELITGLHLFPDVGNDPEELEELIRFRARATDMANWEGDL